MTKKVIRKYYRDGIEYRIKFDKSWKPGANTLVYLDFNGNLTNKGNSGLTFVDAKNNTTFETLSTGKKVANLVGGHATISGIYSNNTLSIPNEFTLSFWVNFTGSVRYNSFGFKSQTYSPDIEYTLILNSVEKPSSVSSSNLGAIVYNNNWIAGGAVNTSINNGQRHNIIWTKDSTGNKYYIDNVNVTMSYSRGNSSNTTSGTTYVLVGYLSTATSGIYAYTGKLGDYIIENKVRTAQEISDYYNNTKSNYGL